MTVKLQISVSSVLPLNLSNKMGESIELHPETLRKLQRQCHFFSVYNQSMHISQTACMSSVVMFNMKLGKSISSAEKKRRRGGLEEELQF